jgi:tRNA (5-methylaminomethyl-2-thiouridylate)-methyltransferase
MKGRVIVGLSGGVDSSVSAYLLKLQGYEVITAYVLLYKEAQNPYACCGLGSIQFARRVAIKLGLEFYEIDYSEGFKRDIVGYFIREYSRNRTPNPCLFCNRDYKIRALFDLAEKLKADFVATGHYITKGIIQGVEVMRRGVDKKKDQSYFMFRIPREWIPRLLFPVGELTKEEVRKIALEANLPTARKPESQDLCFIDGDYRDFLIKHNVEPKGGKFIYKGRVVGEHRGSFFYTVGQRRGLNVSLGKRVYVKGFENGDVILDDLEGVMAKAILVEDLNWHFFPGEEFEADVQVRAGIQTYKALVKVYENSAYVEFYEKAFAPTPGQGAAFYLGDLLLGGGTIEKVFY